MKTAGVALALILALLVPGTSSAQEALFAERSAAAGAAVADMAQELGVVRARAVALNLPALPGFDGASALPPAGHTLRLNLFDDVVLSARMTRAERLEKGLAWSGRLVGDEASAVNIVVYDGIVTGSVNGTSGSYRIGWDGVGHVVYEVDYDEFPEADDCGRDRLDAVQSEAESEPGAAIDSGAIIDVMVVYTPAARAAEGGTSAMMSRINLAISETNSSYANSGIVQRLNLVHAAEVSYTEASPTASQYGIEIDLERLTNTGDGYIDNVHTLRNTYRADLVALFGYGYASGEGICGIAWLYPSVAANAFSVVDGRTCATGYYSFGHEIGHNQGLNHAHGDPTGTGAYPYSYGHKWPGYRSVMAYSPGTRVQYFSNPNVNHPGYPSGIYPTGIADYADNARSLNNTRVTVANWRAAAVPTVKVTQPNGGESFPVGSILPITWTSSALDANAQIRLSYTNGSTTTAIATVPSPSETHYDWTVPNAIGSSWKVEVCSWVGSSCEAEDQSDATFSITAPAPPPAPRSDFSGDGKTDLIWRNSRTGYLSAWYMDGITRSGAGLYLSPNRVADLRWEPAGVGDFNSDGKPDLLWWNSASGHLSVWYMNGTARVGPGVYLSPSQLADTNWRVVGVADFNSDGKPDILWHHRTQGRLQVWQMNGATRIGSAVDLSPDRVSDTRWEVAGAGDLNADGRADLVWRNKTTGDLSAWLMNGVARVGGGLYLDPPRVADVNWQIVGVADFNSDGKADLLWWHRGTGYLSVWYMNGLTRMGSGQYLSPNRVSDTSWRVILR